MFGDPLDVAMRCADDPRYPGCPFVVPDGIRLPASSLRMHRSTVHEGDTRLASGRTSAATNRDKANFCALYRVVGTIDNALFHAPKHHLHVDPEIAAFWASDYDEGAFEVDEKKIGMWERKLRQAEEWDARKTNAINRQVVQMAGMQFVQGKIQLSDMSTAYRYIGDTWHWGEKAVKEAYGKEQPREQPISVGRLVINAGAPPPKRLSAGKKAQIINAEVREIPQIGDGDRA